MFQLVQRRRIVTTIHTATYMQNVFVDCLLCKYSKSAK